MFFRSFSMNVSFVDAVPRTLVACALCCNSTLSHHLHVCIVGGAFEDQPLHAYFKTLPHHSSSEQTRISIIVHITSCWTITLASLLQLAVLFQKSQSCTVLLLHVWTCCRHQHSFLYLEAMAAVKGLHSVIHLAMLRMILTCVFISLQSLLFFVVRHVSAASFFK